MSQYIVIGTSPFNDTSVAIGPFRTVDKALYNTVELEYKGWNTEIVTLLPIVEVGYVTNEEE